MFFGTEDIQVLESIAKAVELVIAYRPDESNKIGLLQTTLLVLGYIPCLLRLELGLNFYL